MGVTLHDPLALYAFLSPEWLFFKKQRIFVETAGEMTRGFTVNMALSGDYDLVLLDLMLPKRDGFSVCQEIRKTLSTPIIMVTAKEEDADKIMGLELGADDYVTKPFSVKVLLARIKANIRRYSGEVVETVTPADSEEDKIVIDKDYVAERFSDTIHSEDLDRYIL